jgi:hypothetical protein
MHVIASMELVRELATLQPGVPVLSVYVRTDPRDPANTAVTPRWLVELRNGLREVADAANREESRSHRLARRELCARAEREVLALDPRERARGLAWFITSNGAVNRRFTLQLPPRVTLVRWDDRPFVSPLVDVVDRGRPTGLVLVSAEAVRLLHWQARRVAQPERSLYELELGQWRDYDAYVGHPGRTPGGMHVATFDQRVDEWRQRFLTEAAIATGQQITEFGWHRMLLAGDRRVVDGFADRLPDWVRERVIGVVDVNLIWEEPAAVADRLENALDEAWSRDAHALVDRAIQAASQGGKGAVGWAEVLDCLVQHRVEHLVFAVNATPNPELLAPHIRDALGRRRCSSSAPSSTRSPPPLTSLPCPSMSDRCSGPAELSPPCDIDFP